jgi:hypothetical protein
MTMYFHNNCPRRISGGGDPRIVDGVCKLCGESFSRKVAEATVPDLDRGQVFRERFDREVEAKKKLAEQVLEAGRRASSTLSDSMIAQVLESLAREIKSGRLR